MYNKIRRKMNKLTIYVVRYRSHKYHHNISVDSAPCKNCMKKIKQIGIKKIVYVERNGDIKKTLSKNYLSDFITSGDRVLKNNNVHIQY